VPGIVASRLKVDVMSVRAEAMLLVKVEVMLSVEGAGAAVAWVARREVVAASPAVASIAAVRRIGVNRMVSLLTMRTHSGADAS